MLIFIRALCSLTSACLNLGNMLIKIQICNFIQGVVKGDASANPPFTSVNFYAENQGAVHTLNTTGVLVFFPFTVWNSCISLINGELRSQV